MLQRTRHSPVGKHPKPENKAGLQQFKCVQTQGSSWRLDCPTIILPKLGFEILQSTGIGITFSKEDKLRALAMYNCLKHIDGFEHKQFSDAIEAVIHIFKEETRLLGGFRYGISDNYNTLEQVLNGSYNLEIIYEEFSTWGEGQWIGYKNVLNATHHNQLLQDAMLMCINLITTDFGFCIFDKEGCYCVPSIDDWYSWETETMELADDATAEEIHEHEEILKSYDNCFEEYKRENPPILNAIESAKFNRKTIEKCIKAHEGGDIAVWMKHILFLYDRDFSLINYMPGAEETYNEDDQMVSPISGYGYIYDADSLYTGYVLEQWNNIAGEAGVIPISNHCIINNKDGIIKHPGCEPVCAWIDKLFAFDIEKLSYPKPVKKKKYVP